MRFKVGNSEYFSIKYDGSALREHEMDVKDLAPALLAVGDLFNDANQVFNEGRGSVSVKIKGGFHDGCFDIMLAVHQTFNELISGNNLNNAADLCQIIGFVKQMGVGVAGGVIGLIGWIRNRPASVESLPNGNLLVTIEEESRETNAKIWDLAYNQEVRKSVKKIIADPLKREGIEKLIISSDNAEPILIDKISSRYFEMPSDDQVNVISESVYQAELQIMTVSFREGNKWRFSDGASTLLASITDQEYLERISTGVQKVGAQDMLRVLMKRTQYQSSNGSKTEYEIIKVIEHKTNYQRTIFDELNE